MGELVLTCIISDSLVCYVHEILFKVYICHYLTFNLKKSQHFFSEHPQKPEKKTRGPPSPYKHSRL